MSLELPYGYTDLNPQGSSNVDAKYGYYNSISEALINVPLAMRKGGRTVGIKQADGSIIEYWWENDNDLSDEGLVKKKAEPFDPTQLEADIQNLENTKQDNLGFTPENIANKGGLLNPSNITYPTTQEVSDALGGKVDKEAGKGLSQENYTTAEKDKLAGLESSKWRGLYISKSALELANPTPEGGDYADVDAGTGSDTIRYVYDETDGEWIESGSGAPLTAEQIKQMYESNTDTNAFTDSLKSWLQGMTAQFTTVLKNSYDNAVTWISTNGQNILDHINSAHAPADAQKNVKSDWEATTGDAEILNKPTKTSGFLNDGEDGINPFVSVSDIYRGSVLLDYDFVNVPNTYEYDVTVRKYIIDDNYFNDPNAATTRVTLEPSHATLNRRDVVVINLAGVISVKTGTPSAAPFAPNIDYNTELVIKEILVTAGTTAPTEVNTLIVYDENLGTPTEFSTSVIGADINLADTTRAQSGTVSVLFKENTTESDVAVFTAPTPFLMSDYDSLNFWVYLVEQHSMTFSIGAYRSSGTLIRQKTLYKDSFTQAGEWILVSIPTTELIPTIITELNEVPVGSIRISKVSGASHVHFDNIFLQGGITNNLSAHNSLSGKQGGNEQLDEYYHLSKADYLKVLALNPDFTTQIINSGGNYNDLEVTADLLVFTNENAQAVLNGVWGRKEFHILNLSSQYEIQINHDSSSVSGNGQPIMLPTNSGTAGIKGTARVLQTDSYGYFVADTWGSKYRPEFAEVTEDKVMLVGGDHRAKAEDIIELKFYRTNQATSMDSAELEIEYPDSIQGTEVICTPINKKYEKIDNLGNWVEIDFVTA